MTFGRLVIGIIGIPLGFVILFYRAAIKQFMGNIAWAEKYLGLGGTWTFIVILGVLTSVLSFLWMMGVIQGFVSDEFGAFFRPPAQ